MFRKNSVFVLFFFTTLFFINQQNIFACSCGAKPTVLDSFEGSDLVVVTKIVSVEKVGEKQREYDIHHIKSTKMVVEKVYKGNVKVGDEMTFAQGGGADCIWTFDEENIGDKFLFYLGKPSKGHPVFDEEKDTSPMYYAGACGRSKGFDYAADDLSYLDNIEKVRGKTRISGTLDSWYKDRPSFANIKIKIIGKDKTYEAKTDKTGFFEIYDLPAGQYLIKPQMPKGWKIDEYMLQYSPSIQGYYGEITLKSKNQIPLILEKKKHAGLDLLFVIDNAIRGKVFSPTGKLMENVCLKAVSTELKEGDYRGKTGCTDEKGEFEIDEVSPGNYILVINDDGKMDGDEPFGTLFYPGVSEYKSAGVISIEIGEFINNTDIQIPKAVELIEITGKFLYSDGKPVVDERIEFKPFQNNNYDETNVKSDGQGRFTIKIPKGAGGKLFGEMYTYIGEFKNCAKLEKIIKATGKTFLTVTTNELEIQENENLTDINLTFPFPSCAKAKD